MKQKLTPNKTDYKMPFTQNQEYTFILIEPGLSDDEDMIVDEICSQTGLQRTGFGIATSTPELISKLFSNAPSINLGKPGDEIFVVFFEGPNAAGILPSRAQAIRHTINLIGTGFYVPEKTKLNHDATALSYLHKTGHVNIQSLRSREILSDIIQQTAEKEKA